MAEYEFECRRCKKVFTLFMRVSEREKRGRRAAHASVRGEDREEELART
jgi:hypothetical protein